MAESSIITREMIEAGARALYLKDRGVPDDAWDRDLPESTMELWRGYARAALTASAAAMFGAKRQPHYTHACAGVEGMSATLHLRDGSLELVFKDEEVDLIREEGEDLYVARIEASEVLHLRQWLIDFLPASEAEIRPVELRSETVEAAARDVIAENADCRRPAVACGAGGTGAGDCGCRITADSILEMAALATGGARG